MSGTTIMIIGGAIDIIFLLIGIIAAEGSRWSGWGAGVPHHAGRAAMLCVLRLASDCPRTYTPGISRPFATTVIALT